MYIYIYIYIIYCYNICQVKTIDESIEELKSDQKTKVRAL